jgi:ankyrin repeat protein
MELYQCCTKGDLETLKNLIDIKKYSILEEVSKNGFYWTMFHYASHYGKIEVLKYLIDKFNNHPDKFEIFNL